MQCKCAEAKRQNFTHSPVNGCLVGYLSHMTYVRMYVCTYVCTYVCMYVCLYVCMCVYLCLFVCMCVYVCLYVCMFVCMCVCMCVYVCLYVCMCVYVYLYVCMGVKLEDCKNLPSHLSNTKVNVCLYIHCICIFFLFLVPILRNFKTYFSDVEI